jgi:tetratricopeptide (TPR) repeat protein
LRALKARGDSRVKFFRGTPWTALLVAGLACPRVYASESSEELVRQARAHEAADEDALAARRYTEALTIDEMDAEAWLGLAQLRMRTGDAVEAERVYTAALVRLPLLATALKGRAHARWLLGRHAEAEVDLQAFADISKEPGALRELAEWFGVDGRTPAELATWRYLLATPDQSESELREARKMVRALVIVVDGADPASTPLDRDPTRVALARIARSAP